MLKRLKLENFKAWRNADLKFGKVTGLFGTNSAGKSSLLHLLLLLKQTRNATDRSVVLDFGGRGAMVNLGTFQEVVHGRKNDQTIGWTLDWTPLNRLEIEVEGPLGSSTGPRSEETLQTSFRVGLQDKFLWPRELVYRFREVNFRFRPKAGSKKKFELVADPQDIEFLRGQGRPPPLPHPTKGYLFPSKVKSYYQNAEFLGDFELEYEKLMDSIYYLGPLRDYPHREYHWAGSSPEDVGQRGERAIDAILAATVRDEKRQLRPRARKKPFQGMIAHLLNELGLIQSFELKPISGGTNLYQAMVKTSSSSVPTALTDVGFGVSQVLPALVLLYYVPEGSTVLMEQPEIHLHPSVQSGLADVMLNVAEMRNVQIVVESHSEHFLRRLQRRVAEGGASAEDVKLYFVSSRGGQAQISDVLLNKWGEIEKWPENFFGDEMGEIAAIVESSLKRREEQSE